MTAQNEPGSLINLEMLHTLANGDKAFVAEMVSNFVQESGQLMQQIGEALQQADHQAIYHAAHALKSLLVYVGLDKHIGAAIAEIEILGRDKGPMQQVQQLYTMAEGTYAKGMRELQSLPLN